jgi:indole-3-glycerol phosphate synthase
LILTEIVNNKLKEVAQRKKRHPLEALSSRIAALVPTRNFREAISSSAKINIIAEIKRSSPSSGIMIGNYNPEKLARIYEENGASAISVLTDKKFFGGDLGDLNKAKEACSLPILAKEFIVDEYQIYEARLLGADAILLIARLLSREKLKKYLDLASKLDLECLVEIHEEKEWEKIEDLPLDVVGINNRNLASLKVDLEVSFDLIKKIPSHKIIVSESGIDSREDIHRLKEAGVDAFLIGGALLKSRDVGKKLRELAGRQMLNRKVNAQ